MKAVLADSGPLYALADISDQYHNRAQRELESIEKRGLSVMVNYATLCESQTLVLRRLGGRYAQQWLTEIIQGTVLLNPEPGDYLRGAEMLPGFPDQSITLVDAVTAVLGRRLRMDVWTFDRHFEIMGAAVLRAR